MQVNRVITKKDLYAIQEALEDAGYGDCGLEVLIKVRTRDILNKVNEEFYYSSNDGGTPPDNVNKIVVTVKGVKFRYEADDSIKT
jgi:hypothetical protein